MLRIQSDNTTFFFFFMKDERKGNRKLGRCQEKNMRGTGKGLLPPWLQPWFLCQVWPQAARPTRWGRRSLIGAAGTAKDSNDSKDS